MLSKRKNMKEKLQEGIEYAKAVPVVALCYLVYGLVNIPMEVYMGIRGRNNPSSRSEQVKNMMLSAYLSGIDYSNSFGLLFWRREDRHEAQLQIREALGGHDQRDRAFDAMMDEEMASYAGNHARQFRYLTIPSQVDGERIDN